ncbi:MAG: hypothetical protein LAT63_10625 [Marinobacter sp.]|nr:hypothetical protein [Marinobacter sp.]
MPAFSVLAALYLAQGLPSGLFAHALPVFWREAGVDLVWIGAIKLLALPWVLKVFWSSAMDRSLLNGTSAGQWITRLQLLAAALLVLLAWQGLTPAGWGVFAVLLLILGLNLLMATQDIVTDGLAVRWIPARWRGLANSIQVGGYKVGMLAGGAGLLMLSGSWATEQVVLGLGVLLLLLVLVVRCFQPLMAPRATPSGYRSAGLMDAFYAFISRPGMLIWLLVLLSYKVADAMGSGMMRPLLTDLGWSRPEIGQFTLVGTLVGLLGAGMGGWLFLRLGGWWSLLLAGVAQAVSIAAWVLIVWREPTLVLVYSIGLFEQWADGWSTVALFAVMMSFCREGWEGTDYTIQASLQVVSAGVLGLLGGVIAQILGYGQLFVLAGLLGAGVLVLMVRYRPLLPDNLS